MAKPDPSRVAPPVGSDEHKRVLDRALELITRAERPHTALVRGWQDQLRAFYALPARGAKKQNPWQSDIRNPYAYEQVMTMIPRLVDADYKVDLIPLQKGISRDHLLTTERAIDHWLWRDNFLTKQVNFVMPLSVMGIGWGKTSWAWKKAPRTIRSTTEEMMAPPFGPGLPPTRRVMEVVDDRPRMTIPHPFDVLWDPAAVMFEDNRFIIHRIFLAPAQLRARHRRQDDSGRWVGAYENCEHVKGSGKERDEHLPNELPQHVQERRGENRVEVMEVHDLERGRIYTIANRCVVLRDIENPYPYGEHPFFCASTQPDIGRLDGISEVKMLMTLQNMLWLLENQRLDNTRLSMDVVLMIRDTVENFDELELRPGAKWPLANPNGDVVPLNLPQPQLSSIQDIEALRGRMQAITGMTYLTGADPNAMGVNQNTATGITAIQAEMKERVGLRTALVRSNAYERHVNLSLALAGQYLTQPFMVHSGDHYSDPVEVGPEVFQSQMWARSRMTTDAINKMNVQQNAIQGIQSIAAIMNLGVAMPDGKIPNPEPFLQMLAEANERPLDDFKMDPPPPPMDTSMMDPNQQLTPPSEQGGDY